MMTDDRRMWLRGAYLDRIVEVAKHYAADHSHFADAEWQTYIADEFAYLSELTAEDHAYLRDQAGLEAFRQIVVALLAAREAAVEKFRIDNADVIQPEARFALDLGWISLLQHAVDRVRTYPDVWRARIDGAKEKFGCAVVHISCDYSARGCRSEVERLREEIRLRSLATCECCGEPGRLRLSGYAKTVCDKHASVMGEFRVDDGMHADPWAWNDDAGRIEDLLKKGRALISGYPAESSELLRDMAHVRPRPREHVIDPLRATDIGKRIDDDTWSREGREQELLIELGYHIEDAVNGCAVKEEHLDKYVRDEVDGWRVVQPLTDPEKEFLRGYLRGLISDEYDRIKNND